MPKKYFIIGFCGLLLLFALTVYICDRKAKNAARGRLFSYTNEIPYNKVGLLLGTSKWIGEVINPYYENRITAARDLFKAGKIKYLIISGDNGRTDYNEPATMRSDLMLQGVDSAKIFLDYAGFRTFDSMIRLKEVFGQDSVTVISQQFHNERAIYIAGREKIFAVGYNAADVTGSGSVKTALREKLARVKMIMDYWFHVKPKYLGTKITIPD